MQPPADDSPSTTQSHLIMAGEPSSICSYVCYLYINIYLYICMWCVDNESAFLDDAPPSPPVDTEESSYDSGQMVIKSRGLQGVDIPQDVMNMVYAAGGRTSKRRTRPGLHNVKRLVMTHNNITTLKTVQLRPLSNLLHLDLSFNSIECIEGEFPSQLEVLKLQRNQLRKVSGLLLCPSLRVLDLSHNKIKNIDGLPTSLECLDLGYNLIAGEVNLRILSLCQQITSISIDGNPVMDRLQKTCKARLLSLLPKLREVNHTVLPRARKLPKEPEPAPLPHESFVWPDSPRQKGRKSYSGSRSPATLATRTKRRSRHAQQQTDERLFREAEVQRRAREKELAQLTESFQTMARTVYTDNMKLKAGGRTRLQLEEISRKLNSWRPMHIKKMEEEEVSWGIAWIGLCEMWVVFVRWGPNRDLL